MEISEEDIARAEQRGKELLQHFPAIIGVRYDDASFHVLFNLSNGEALAVPRAQLKGLEHATGADMERFEISPSGLGVHFPTLDADLYLPSLLHSLGLTVQAP